MRSAEVCGKAAGRFIVYFTCIFVGEIVLGGGLKESFLGASISAGICVPLLWHFDKNDYDEKG